MLGLQAVVAVRQVSWEGGGRKVGGGGGGCGGGWGGGWRRGRGVYTSSKASAHKCGCDLKLATDERRHAVYITVSVLKSQC